MKKNKILLTEEIYLEIKKMIADYENDQLNEDNAGCDEQPYLKTVTIETGREYNPNYGDNRKCKCGHTYYRHFDSYEQMKAVGCKYCDCYIFEESQ